MIIPIGPKLAECIVMAYYARRPMVLEGPTGIGKSEFIEQITHAIDGGIGFIVKDLSPLEPPDLIGIPIIRERGGLHRTEYALPDFWPTEGKGILFFDELNRAQTAVLNPIIQLISTGMMGGGYSVPPGWVIMAAMNPDKDRDYLGAYQLDKALLARFGKIMVTADIALWLSWAVKNEIHPLVISFIRASPDAFLGEKSNPRAWKYVSDHVHVQQQYQLSLDSLIVNVASKVGDVLAMSFIASMQNSQSIELPTPALIITSWGKKDQEIIQRISKQGDTAKLAAFTRSLMLYLQDPDHHSLIEESKPKISNLRKIIACMSAEYRHAIIQHSPRVLDIGVKQ